MSIKKLKNELAPSLAVIWFFTLELIKDKFPNRKFSFFWAIIQPMVMFALYVSVFGLIFKAKWSTEINDMSSFALLLFVGLCFHNCLVDGITSSSTLFFRYANGLKKLNMKPLFLVAAQANANFVIFLVNFLVFTAGFLFLKGVPPALIVFLPLVLMIFYIFTFLIIQISSVVFVFDARLKNFLPFIPTFLLFLSPIFYSLEIIPSEQRFLVYFNPLATLIQGTRALFFDGIHYNITALLLLFLICTIMLYLIQNLFKFFASRLPDVL